MSQSPNFFPDGSPDHEGFPPSDLVDYLRAKFQDAHAQDETSRFAKLLVINGYFLMKETLPGKHEATRGTVRIILKPPHPGDIPGYYAEAYAVFLRGRDGHTVGDITGLFADQFLVREFTDGLAGEFWLVTEDGVFPADVEHFDAIEGYSRVGDAGAEEALAPLERAEEMLQRLSTYNIVASKE